MCVAFEHVRWAQHEEEKKAQTEARQQARREAEIMQQQQHLTRECKLCEQKYTNATNHDKACRCEALHPEHSVLVVR